MKIKLTSIKEKIKLIICLILKFVFRKTKVQLPFFEPKLSTLHNSVATELVMATHPSARNQILNQCTNICCKKAFLEGYTGFCASVVDSTPAKFENLKTFPVDLTYTSFAEMKMIIKRMLDNGLYIFFNGIDDYYIPGKTFYGKKHRNHDGVFTGYDETDKTYTIAAYNSDWVLSNFKIPQKSFFLSVKKALERGYTPFIRGLLAKDGETEINIQAIIVGLQKYIDERIGDGTNIELDHIFVTHAGCDDEIVQKCVAQVKAAAPFKEVHLTRAGCTISSHCGKNTLGVLFIRKGSLT